MYLIRKFVRNSHKCIKAIHVTLNYYYQYENEDNIQDETYTPFPGIRAMRAYCENEYKPKKMPDAKKCLIEMVKIQLKVIFIQI